MSTTQAADRFTTLPDDQTLAEPTAALEEHGFSTEVVENLDDARDAVLARVEEATGVTPTSFADFARRSAASCAVDESR